MYLLNGEIKLLFHPLYSPLHRTNPRNKIRVYGLCDSTMFPVLQCTWSASIHTLYALQNINPSGTKGFGTHTKHQGGGVEKNTP